MATRNQPYTRSQDEIRVLAPWAYYLFAAVFVAGTILFTAIVGLDAKAPRPPFRLLIGLLCGSFLACYAVLIGYVNQDAGRRRMSRLLWTLVAIFVPNGLGIVLYFVLRKPRVAHCPQCEAEVEPGFSFCPRCRNRLQPACPHCQRSVNPGNKFCPYCGGDLESNAVVSSSTATNQP